MRRTTTLLVAVLTLTIPPGAHAQVTFNSFNFWTQCTVGSLRACASTEIWNEIDPVSGEVFLAARMSNLQGTPGFTDLQPAGMTAFSINNLRLETVGPGTPSTGSLDGQFGSLSGNASWCVTLLTSSCVTASDGIGDNPFLVSDLAGNWRLNVGILTDGLGTTMWGCDVVSGPEVISAVSTCGGFVTWRLRPRHAFPTTTFVLRPNNQSSISYFYHSADFSTQATCTTGIDCAMVTPEPVTTVLMATGLLGIAGVAAARRRRRLSAEA
jgi:hypothetical protein